jgi:hypothetical protein
MLRKLTIVNLDGQTDLLSTALPWTSLRCPELTASKLPSCKFSSSFPSYTRASKPCKVYPLTDANEFVVFLQDLIKHQLIFPPSTTSIHSSGASPLLYFALESITNKSFIDMMNNLFTQLDYLRLPTRHPLFSIRSQSIEYCIQWLGPKRSRSWSVRTLTCSSP